MLSGRGLCDELITRPEEFYRLCCIVACDLETSRMGAPYIYDISRLRVKQNALLDIEKHWTERCFTFFFLKWLTEGPDIFSTSPAFSIYPENEGNRFP